MIKIEVEQAAFEFLKKRIPQSFTSEKQMEEMALAGKSSTFDAFIAGVAWAVRNLNSTGEPGK